MNEEQNLKSLSQSDIQVYLQFLIEVLQATRNSNGDAQVVYLLLAANTDKTNLILAEILPRFVSAVLRKVPTGTVQSLVADIVTFSDLIQQFPLGNKASNMEVAIAGYKIALSIYTRKDFPVEWAMTQNNLGATYRNRILGGKAENIEAAIVAYDRALTIYTHEAFPVDWATTQNNLGLAYNDRIIGEKAENIEQAIAAYDRALTIYTREAFPVDWARTQNNLGIAYCNRILEDKAENLEQAIAAYYRALTVYTREDFPADWARTQNNLGNAYLYRILGKKAENLEQAIAAYYRALTIYTDENFPVDWARTQNNLGIAYCNRILEDKAENLEQAIAAYYRALTIYTHKDFPVDWAMTKNNLGNAYFHRILGKKAENLEQAIADFNLALTVRTREDFPVDWAMTQICLGNAYLYRIIGDEANNIEQAIAAYELALTVYTHDAFPVDWAMTQINLGSAYSKRILGEPSENLEQDIAAYNAALTVYNREAFPVNWAMTQSGLGAAYCYRILGEKAENLEQAIAAFNETLTVYTRDAFPENHAETLYNLGSAYQDANNFNLAYRTFEIAIETVEYLRGEIASGDESKRKQAEEWNRLYVRMIETCLALGFTHQAIEYSDRSKTRNLVELLATRHLYPKGKIPENQRQKLQQLRREIDVEKRRLTTDSQPDYTQINQLRQRYNELYPLAPISFEQIQALLDDNTAIIKWYIYYDCFSATIITHDNDIRWQSSQLDWENLQKWLNNYLQTYIAIKQTEPESAEQQELQNHWRNRLDSRLKNLAQILHIDDILAQIPSTINQLIFIPHRYLHILPLHSLPVSPEIWQHFNPESGSTPSHPYLLDCFNSGVRYAPSCKLLQELQPQQRPKFERLFAIQTPTEDLYEKDLGAVTAIKKQFTDSFCILKQSQAQKSEILRIDASTNTVNLHEQLLTSHSAFFFCHGYFNFDAPLDSGLKLADEDLTLADIIEHFDLKTCRLVTLSACETGLIDFTNTSDEYIGLPNGFLLAGSTNVVSSLWAVSSVATAFLMVKFYQELQQQTNIALALNTAQRWLRDTTVQGFQTWLGNSPLDRVWRRELRKYFDRIQAQQGASTKPFEQPYYWAAFCTIGKGE